MLRWLVPAPGVVLALLVSGAVLVVGSPAVANVSCPNGQVQEIGGTAVCVVTSHTADTTVNGPPAQVAVTGSSARERWCPADHAPPGFAGAPEGMVPCYIDRLGWFDRADCYYGQQDPVPPTLDVEGLPGYAEHGSDGLVYRRFCIAEHLGLPPGYSWQGSHFLILPGPPEFEGGTTPLADAQAPGGPLVAATATVQEIMWDPGDGSEPLPCGQGTAYESGMDVFATDCLRQYERPSRNEPDGTFQILATTTWHVQWWIDGVWDGDLTLDVASAVDIQINELQVLARD